MHFANSASLVLAVAAMASAATIPTLVSFDHLVQAFPRPESTEVQPVNRQINKIKDFLLTDFYVATMADPATSWNRTINCRKNLMTLHYTPLDQDQPMHLAWTNSFTLNI